RAPKRSRKSSFPTSTSAQSGLRSVLVRPTNRINKIRVRFERTGFKLQIQSRIACAQRSRGVDSARRGIEFLRVQLQQSLVVAIAEACGSGHRNVLCHQFRWRIEIERPADVKMFERTSPSLIRVAGYYRVPVKLIHRKTGPFERGQHLS